MKEKITEKGISASKISIIYNGTNTTCFFPEKPDLSLKYSFGLKEDDFVILYAGTIGRANKVEFLINAAIEIEKQGYLKIKFLMVGDGNRKNKVKERAQEFNLKNIIFHEKVPLDQLNKIMQISDIGVVCFAPFKILETNSANKFFDYLAAGLPVLINYKGWQARYLEEFNCGLSANQLDINQFVDNILFFYKNPHLINNYRENARFLAKQKFDRSKLVKELKSVIFRITKLNQ